MIRIFLIFCPLLFSGSSIASPRIFAHYVCVDHSSSPTGTQVDVYIAFGLEGPGAQQGVRVRKLEEDRIFRIAQAQESEAGNLIFQFTNGGFIELESQQANVSRAPINVIVLSVPGLPPEVYGRCELDQNEVGFTVGN